jgi:hypothetical protein
MSLDNFNALNSIMTKHDREQLIELGVETLADTLLNLCQISPDANTAVKRLLSTPKENIKRLKDKLASLKRGRRFIDWNETAGFANDLEQLLSDIAASVQDPDVGVELVTRFFELDSSIFDRCDDSNGDIGDVFNYSACNLFVQFANRCADKQKIVDCVITLNQQDGYGVRDGLFDKANEYLPESVLRSMVDRLWNLLETEKNDYQKSQWQSAIQSIARQLKDAVLFENAALSCDEIYPALWLEVAEVYLEAGKPEIALTRLNKIPEEEFFKREERDQLYLAIYHQLGDSKAETDMAWHGRYSTHGAILRH